MIRVLSGLFLICSGVAVGLAPTPPRDIPPPFPARSIYIHFAEFMDAQHILQSIPNGGDIHVWATKLVPMGDADEDGDVDLHDFAAFQVCSGQWAPWFPLTITVPCSGWPCVKFDFDGDGWVSPNDTIHMHHNLAWFPAIPESNPGLCP